MNYNVPTCDNYEFTLEAWTDSGPWEGSSPVEGIVSSTGEDSHSCSSCGLEFGDSAIKCSMVIKPMNAGVRTVKSNPRHPDVIRKVKMRVQVAP